jgi:hypothetical protein
MVSNRGRIRGRVRSRVSRDSKVNEASSKGNNRGNSKDKRANRDNQANQDSKALKTVNSKVASRQAVHKTAASRKATEIVAASIAQHQWVAAGAITASFPPRSASDFAKRRICGASGARLVWAPESSTMEGDAATAALLKADVVEPLRQLELELSRQLQQQSGRTNLRLRDEGAAPEKYRRAVEEYYRKLSGGRQRQ